MMHHSFLSRKSRHSPKFVLSCALCLLADVESLRAPAQYLSRGPSVQSRFYLWITLVAVGVLWLIILSWDKCRRRLGERFVSHSHALFYELCDVHGLSRRQRQLLLVAATEFEAEQPGLVFVDPGILLRISERDRTRGAQYVALAKALFGEEIVGDFAAKS